MLLCVVCAFSFLLLSGCSSRDNTQPYAIGDFALADGSFLPASTVLSDEQKNMVVAVIYRLPSSSDGNTRETDNTRETGNSRETGNTKAMGVSVHHDSSYISWCARDAAAFTVNIESIYCEPREVGTNGVNSFVFDDDCDVNGSDNLEQIGLYLASHGFTDDTSIPEKYPAFYYARGFGEGWYLPSLAELYEVWEADKVSGGAVSASLAACGGDVFGNGCYWSSSDFPGRVQGAYILSFSDGSWYEYGKFCQFHLYKVCAVREF